MGIGNIGDKAVGSIQAGLDDAGRMATDALTYPLKAANRLLSDLERQVPTGQSLPELPGLGMQSLPELPGLGMQSLPELPVPKGMQSRIPTLTLPSPSGGQQSVPIAPPIPIPEGQAQSMIPGLSFERPEIGKNVQDSDILLVGDSFGQGSEATDLLLMS